MESNLYMNKQIDKKKRRVRHYNAERDEFEPPAANGTVCGRVFYLSNLGKRLSTKHALRKVCTDTDAYQYADSTCTRK